MLPALSETLTKHVAVADVNRNTRQSSWWKIHEASMLAVGFYKKSITQHDTLFNLGEYLIMDRNFLNYNVSPFLAGGILWF